MEMTPQGEIIDAAGGIRLTCAARGSYGKIEETMGLCPIRCQEPEVFEFSVSLRGGLTKGM